MIRINEQITAPRLDLILPNGEIWRNIALDFARERAKAYNLDLVELDPGGPGDRLPRCKITDAAPWRARMARHARHLEHERLEREVIEEARVLVY
jgi:translation initiation factor IF-3